MFKTPETDTLMVLAILEHAARAVMMSLGFIGFNDALGEAFYAEFDKFAESRKIRIVASERYAPRDTSVTAQVLKIVAANPDMVVIGASGTPAVLPAKALAERGYKGRIYFNHGVANNDFLRVGGKDVEGAYVPTSPVVVADSLPADHPARAAALAGAIHPPIVLRNFHTYDEASLRRSLAHHAEIVAAVRAGDAAWAQAVMTAHISNARAVMVRAARQNAIREEEAS
jgi:ABC-type branched-subunit amino acid transport system substrate-binding protein